MILDLTREVVLCDLMVNVSRQLHSPSSWCTMAADSRSIQGLPGRPNRFMQVPVSISVLLI